MTATKTVQFSVGGVENPTSKVTKPNDPASWKQIGLICLLGLGGYHTEAANAFRKSATGRLLKGAASLAIEALKSGDLRKASAIIKANEPWTVAPVQQQQQQPMFAVGNGRMVR